MASNVIPFKKRNLNDSAMLELDNEELKALSTIKMKAFSPPVKNKPTLFELLRQTGVPFNDGLHIVLEEMK